MSKSAIDMMRIQRFHPYEVVESTLGVDTTKKDDSLQIKPSSKKMRFSKDSDQSQYSLFHENPQTEKNNRDSSSLKKFLSMLDDIKDDRNDGDEGKIVKETNQDKDDRPIHRLIQIPPTNRKKWPQKNCAYCRSHKVRRDTRYICSSCNTALCKGCFSNYHTNIQEY